MSIVNASFYVHLCANYRRRVFILGPSHHVALPDCALSRQTHYETPLYDLEIDQEGVYPHCVFMLAYIRFLFYIILEGSAQIIIMI